MTETNAPAAGPAEGRPPRRPEDWTAEERLRVVLEASRLSSDELGTLLRREGLHSSQLEAWRAAVHQASLQALQAPSAKRAKESAEARRVRELEKQLRRKDKALAEAAALLVLSKKVNALWGDEDGDTSEERDK